ncbi:MAG: ATP-binding protein [Deltaproteobacteria bacterium]|nr:ATP-binding protein [Deltaproteobacteria bacterium]
MENTRFIRRFQKIDAPSDRSAFLWGPRKTGKTTLLRQQFSHAFWIDLLDYDLFLSLSQRPTRLRQMLEAQSSKTVVIDEVQKIPHLMDEIHWLIENKGYQFILSGSSARKFRRAKANLLGGRAWRFELYPFVTRELKEFQLERALVSGLLPSHYLSSDSQMDLKAYVNDYLKEEIQAEALTRNLPAFSRFLHSAAITNGMLLNYSNAARETGVSVKTIREFYQILEDTLIGRPLLPWKKSKKRRLIETSKFFFFDIGIVSALLMYNSLAPGTREYGRAFEHFILQECWAYRHYSKLEFPITFWRTASGAEVDLILGESEFAIEIKSSEKAGERTKGLHLFQEENTCKKAYIISRDPLPRKLASNVTILPWQIFCEMLWENEII